MEWYMRYMDKKLTNPQTTVFTYHVIGKAKQKVNWVNNQFD